jgi:predicted Zn-dependent peptidase
VGLTVCAGGVLADDSPPPFAQRVVLDGGLALVVRPIDDPDADQASFRLVIAGGASQDALGASGATHVLSHALWDGAIERLERRAGSGDAGAEALLRSMGDRRHAHRAARVDMFGLVFEVDLTGANERVIEEAVRFLGEIASLQGLDAESLTRGRATALEELRGWSSPYLRINQAATKALFEPLGIPPGPYVGRADEIAALDPAALRDQAQRMFARGKTTLIAAGAVDTAHLADTATGAALNDPEPMCPVVVPPPGLPTRAIVVKDSEATAGVVEIMGVERTPSALPMRERLLRGAAAEAVRRRIETATAEMTGEDALSELIVVSKPFAPDSLGSPGVWINIVHAMNAPGRWEHAMRVLATELRRIEQHGFTEAEARLAFTRSLRDLRERADEEVAGDPRVAANRLAGRTAMGEPLISAQEELLGAQAALDDATAEDLRGAAVRAFIDAGSFERRGLSLLAATNAKDGSVTEAAVLRVARSALAAETEALPRELTDPASVDALFAPSLDADGVREVRIDPSSEVLSMTLANNIVVHHRAMGGDTGPVVIEAIVRGGEIDEVQGVARGITEASLSAWRDPATRSLGSREISDALAGTSVRVRAWAEPAGVRLRVTAANADAPTAVRLLAALLDAPKVEPAALERWKQSASERAALAITQPFERLRTDLWAIASDNDDARLGFPTTESIAAIDEASAQAWIDRVLSSGQIEVAIVGSVTRDEAAALSGSLLGSLAARPSDDQPGVRADAPRRAEARVETSTAIESKSTHGAALVGVMVDLDASDSAGWASGEIAARALSGRVRAALTGDLAISNEARSLWMPIHGWRGFSLLYTPMLASSATVDDAASAAWAAYRDLAREGMTPEEFVDAREGARRAIAADLEEPESWAESLAGAWMRGQSVATLLERRNATDRATAEDVRSFLASAMERGSVRTVVIPRSAAPDMPDRSTR